MAARKTRLLVANKDYTHSLTIALAKSSFLPQFETSLQRFRKDALATNIPEKAFKPSEHSTSMLLGRLKLKSTQRREQFSKFLHSLDYSKLIGPAPENAQLLSVARKSPDTARSLSHVAPLRINVSGLTSDRPDRSSSRKLHLCAVDPTGRLHPFLRSLIPIFTAAGFPILRPPLKPRFEIVSSYAINWGSSDPFIVQSNGTRRYKKDYRVPNFDARELLKKYEDETWATDVHLERLSLQGIGASERDPDGVKVFKLQPEIDSVALP